MVLVVENDENHTNNTTDKVIDCIREDNLNKLSEMNTNTIQESEDQIKESSHIIKSSINRDNEINCSENSDTENDLNKQNIDVPKDDDNIVSLNQEEDILINKSNIKNKKVRKRITIADSDSEEDIQYEKVLEEETNQDDFQTSRNRIENDSDSTNSNKLQKKRFNFDSSDEDNEEVVNPDNKSNTEEKIKEDSFNKSKNRIDSASDDEMSTNYNKLQKKRINLDSSDEDNDGVITPHNKSFSDGTHIEEHTIYTTNQKGELIADKPIMKSGWRDLCDSDSSEPENEKNSNSNSEKDIFSDEETIQPIHYKKKKKSKKFNDDDDQPSKMTPKEAFKQRQEIESDSQRRIRQSNVSLPYHRPKQYSLKEFLTKRRKFAETVPITTRTPPAVAIKMSNEQLKIISKNLEERHKEVKEFYKSDSDIDDNDNDADYVPPESSTTQIVETLQISQNEENIEQSKECIFSNEQLEDTFSKDTLEDIPIKTVCNDENEIFGAIISPTDENQSIQTSNEIGDDQNSSIADTILSEKITEDTNETTENVFSPNDTGEDEVCVDENKLAEETDTNKSSKIIILDNRLITKVEMTNDVNEEPNSEDYEFNLDSIEETNQNKEFEYGDFDKEIENYSNKLSKLELLKEQISNIKPRLSGGPNNIIDLNNVATPNEVVKLMERFAQHNVKKNIHKDKIKVNILSVESGGEFHTETVLVDVEDDEDIKIEEKPGARLLRLRNELQSQIKQRKSEIWQQKTCAKTEVPNEETCAGEKMDYELGDALLDDDIEEENMTESSAEEDEEDDELEYKLKEDKPSKKSAFVDDEAEESDVDNEEYDVDDEESDVEDKEINNDEDDSNETENTNDNQETVEVNDLKENTDKFDKDQNEEVSFKKPLRRIIKPFNDDSDDEDFSTPTDVVAKITEKLNRSNEESNTQDDYLTPYQVQQNQEKTPAKATQKSPFDNFLTPISYITGLQNLANSASKLKSASNLPSPLKDKDWHTELQKKLFDNSIITNSQEEAMAELCSSETTISSKNISNPNYNSMTLKIPPTVPPNTQDVLNVCSGEFEESSYTDLPSTLPPSTQDVLNMCSGEFTGTSQVFNNTVTHQLNPVQEETTLGEDQDMLISQLLNEEEMEVFKKKFDSPIISYSQKIQEEVKEVEAGGGVIDSDDSDNEGLEVKKKKNQKKLTFSDEDDSSDQESNDDDDEEIDLHDEIDEDDPDPNEVNYDSEENEVEYTVEKEKPGMKLANFIEDEAELSESEWGSADEDERDLDDLEIEQGDVEKFDQKKLKTDLERIHLKRMLDDDNREVKLLQEMLLDDGELHGNGRERQFRWKNIDSMETGDDKIQATSDDENHFDDDESEEQWRKKRHEREMFLKEKKSQTTIEDDDDDLVISSEILKVGHKVIQKSMSNSQSNEKSTEKVTDTGSSPVVKSHFSLIHKRGSFLNRGDKMLQKLAEYNNITTTTVVQGKAAKNSKGFLFQTVVTEEKTTSSLMNLKRKATDGTPKIIKKLRLTDNLSPAVGRKKKSDKILKAKLFGVS